MPEQHGDAAVVETRKGGDVGAAAHPGFEDRLRVKRANGDLERIFEVMMQKGEREARGPSQVSPFAEITDEDIDSLFSE